MYVKKKDDFMPNYKIVFVGAKGVGKTEMIRQYVDLSFSPQYNPTQTFASYNKIINLNQGKDLPPLFIRLNIVDTYFLNFYKNFIVFQ